MKYLFGLFKHNRFKSLNHLQPLYRIKVNNAPLTYSKSYSTSSKESPSSDSKGLFWYQFKIFSVIGVVISSSYLVYIFCTNDYDLNRSRKKLLVNWNSLFYGNTMTRRLSALINSRFNTCLSEELNRELYKYFLNIDLKKENGFRRSDAIFFLSEVGIDEKNKAVDKFISQSHENSREFKLLSGCSLYEFAHLVECLVLDERLKENAAFERDLLEKLRDLNSSNDIELNFPPTTFNLGNPMISEPARKMSEEVARYIKDREESDVFPELEADLERNMRLKKKLESLSKTRRLTEEEKRRLKNINEEIVIVNEELQKHRHNRTRLLLM